MKTLILMRHAKSSGKTPGQADHDRPLNHRGRVDASLMAERLKQGGIFPDEVFCSTARRARETWELMAPTWLDEVPESFEERLYLAPPREILEVAAKADRDTASLLMIGHNPGMEGLISRLTGMSGPVPTAALAWIEVAVDEWPEVREIPDGRLVEFWYPKDGG